MLSRFHPIPERYGQTDGQTHRSIISVLTRDKNLPVIQDHWKMALKIAYSFYSSSIVTLAAQARKQRGYWL